MIINGNIVPKNIRCNKCFKLITWDKQSDEKQILQNRIISCPFCGQDNIINNVSNNILALGQDLNNNNDLNQLILPFETGKVIMNNYWLMPATYFMVYKSGPDSNSYYPLYPLSADIEVGEQYLVYYSIRAQNQTSYQAGIESFIIEEDYSWNWASFLKVGGGLPPTRFMHWIKNTEQNRDKIFNFQYTTQNILNKKEVLSVLENQNVKSFLISYTNAFPFRVSIVKK